MRCIEFQYKKPTASANIDKSVSAVNRSGSFNGKMEINETTSVVTSMVQLFGFVPFTFVRNKYNQIVDFQLSKWMCAYNAVLIAFCISSNYGLLYNIYSGNSIRYEREK